MNDDKLKIDFLKMAETCLVGFSAVFFCALALIPLMALGAIYGARVGTMKTWKWMFESLK